VALSRYLQAPGVVPRHFWYLGDVLAKDLSIFADESGDRGGQARYYLLTLVMHDQSDDISEELARYAESLRLAGLPDVPFHSEPLLNGHKGYQGLGIEERKRMLSRFATLVRHLPICYKTFAYERHEVEDPAALSARMRRDISNFMFDHLAYFQSFDDVKVYYDDGQDVVSRALRDSIGFVLSRGVVERRQTTMTDYRLEQAADYLCTIELAAIKYAAKEDGGTYDRFFGGVGSFKKNWLKQARRKRLG
jgi:hypothetical protein